MPYEYIKLHRSFFTGTMHGEAAYTKVLFLAMLVECTDGTIVATNDYLCRFTNIPEEAVARALEALQQPDPQSTSPELAGRRILAVEDCRNTYRIVNWAKYQPALSSHWKEKPGLTVIDPETGERVERLLPGGQKNPEYQKLYQRAYRALTKERKAAATALEAELGTIGVNAVNSKNVYDPDPKNGDPRAKNGDPRAKNGGADQSPSAQFEPEHGAKNVNCVNFVNKRKENETKSKNKTPPTPLGTRGAKPAGSTKALGRGDPANAETWERFDRAYPRPSNGRPLRLAEARLTWDLLAEAGEDMEAVVEGAARYRRWVEQLRKHEYVAMMTTWLNQRRWEESYAVQPDSDGDRRMEAGPLGGRDFYWDDVPDPKGDQLNGRVGRFRLGPGGERTGEPFSEDRWREAQDAER